MPGNSQAIGRSRTTSITLHLYGYSEGWQSFQFYIKTLHEELLHIDFTDDEWGFLFDVTNGWGVCIRSDLVHLRMQVVDGDRYEYLSGKWFEDQSKVWEDDEGEHYEPSKTMLVFIEKINALNEKQQTAVIFKALTFWQATFWLPIPV